MQPKTKTRAKALVVGAVMAASSLSLSPLADLFPANAAQAALPKTLASSISDADGMSSNEQDCTYKCLRRTSQWDSWTDTSGTGPATLLGIGEEEEVTSLKFHFEVTDEYKDEYVVSQFTYYFGCGSSEANDYWWDLDKGGMGGDTGSIECHPYSNSFDVVLTFPAGAEPNLTDSDGKFQIQNCYTQLVSSVDKKTKIQEAEIVLTAVTANAPQSEDTSEASDEVKAEYPDPDSGTRAEQNTGGLWYSTILYSGAGYTGSTGKYYTFKENGDGTATVTTLNSLKIDDVNLVLTPGETYSEEYYMELDPEKYVSEAAIRAEGMPINSHKFTYGDFGLNAGVNSGTTVIKSLSVTLSAPTDVTRIMYGGGINVKYMSPADTEYSKLLAGLKEGENVGYWYNDVGSDVYKKVLEYEEANPGETVFDIAVEGGSDLAKQTLGSYFTVTWDVPEAVQPYISTANSDSVSFQLWYVEPDKEVTEMNIESAVLTYEESSTFNYTSTATVNNVGTYAIGETVEIPYEDFGMEYEKTSDVYAVQYEITTDVDVSQLLVGGGTSVLEMLNIPDNWYQFDNEFGEVGKPVLVNYEETTVNDRPDPADDTLDVAPYEEPTGRKTYTFTWLMQNEIKMHVSTEQPTDHVTFGAYYGDLSGTEASSYTVDSVTVYYKADDETNPYKTALREGQLEVSPTEMTIIEGTSSQAVLDADGNVTYDADYNAIVGDDAIITVNVADSTARSSMPAVTVTSNDDGTFTVSARDNSAGTLAVITIETPGKQVATVTVTVTDQVDPDKPAETTPTTTTTTTTTTTVTTTEQLVASLYGDVNLDGKVDMADSIVLNKYAINAMDLTALGYLNADVAYDGKVDGDDAMKLLRFNVQLESRLGP